MVSSIDPGLFLKFNSEGQLDGFLITHVDDFLHAGSSEFEKSVVEKLQIIFMMGKTEEKKFKYVGMDIEQTEKGINVSQQDYADKIPVYSLRPERAKESEDDLTEEEKTQLRQMAGQIGWLARGTRPDLTFAQVEMSTKFLNGKVKDLNKAIKAVRKIPNNKSSYKIRNLGSCDEWQVEVSTDASLGNLNEGVDSTAGYIVLLKNPYGNCVPISWSWPSNKIKLQKP